MRGMGLKLAVSIGLFLLTIVLGVLLSKSGQPYNSIVLAVHKISSLGLIALISFMLYGAVRQGQLSALLYVLVALAFISVIALFVSGGMLSQDKYHGLMLTVHRIATASFTISLTIVIVAILKLIKRG